LPAWHCGGKLLTRRQLAAWLRLARPVLSGVTE